ncbi:hypothetical protein FKP32DRAFT_959417 [Trametes sanguinea]|nr:hypothetical protein FKP32DRAFT_959417 [Trametes sanguinea]
MSCGVPVKPSADDCWPPLGIGMNGTLSALRLCAAIGRALNPTSDNVGSTRLVILHAQGVLGTLDARSCRYSCVLTGMFLLRPGATDHPSHIPHISERQLGGEQGKDAAVQPIARRQDAGRGRPRRGSIWCPSVGTLCFRRVHHIGAHRSGRCLVGEFTPETPTAGKAPNEGGLLCSRLLLPFRASTC